MNWIDGMFFLCIVLMGILGFKKGIIGIAVIAASYIAGIAAAVILSEPFGALLSHHTGTPAAFSRVIASLIIFLLVALAVRALGLLLKKLVSAALPGIDRACGLLFGLILAGIMTVITSIFLFISPVDSTAGKLYDSSFTARFVMENIEGNAFRSRDPADQTE